MAVEVHPLSPRPWGVSDPVVAYCNADGAIVRAAEMHRSGGNSHYDEHGMQGSQAIVCIDCKQEGREVAVVLVEARGGNHFRHRPRFAPDTRGHGETAEHIRGKLLIADWAREQEAVLPWTVTEELWHPTARLRSDVRVTLLSGRQAAFEVQRKELPPEDWSRRHGGYERTGVRDVWLWPPDAPRIELDLPGISVVVDVEEERFGILVADYGGRYRHPTAEAYVKNPSHYASAPAAEWGLSEHGLLLPPPELDEFIGRRPTFERLTLLERHRRTGTGGGTPTVRPDVHGEESQSSASDPSTWEDGPSMFVPSGRGDWDWSFSSAPRRQRWAKLSPEDVEVRQAVARSTSTHEYAAIKAPMLALAAVSPETSRRVGEHILTAGPGEVGLWATALQGAQDSDHGYNGPGFAEYMRLQVAIVETIIAVMDVASEDTEDLHRLRQKATKSIRSARGPIEDAAARGITYAVWATGYGKGTAPFYAEAETRSIELIAENLPALLPQSEALRDALRSGQQLTDAVTDILAEVAR